MQACGNAATQLRRIRSNSRPLTHGQPSTLRLSPAASCVAASPAQGSSLRCQSGSSIVCRATAATSSRSAPALVGGSFKARPAKASGAQRQAAVAREPEPQPRRGLTRRSTGAPTAGHQAQAGGTRYIFTGPGLASCRRCPVTSNVRRHKLTLPYHRVP